MLEPSKFRLEIQIRLLIPINHFTLDTTDGAEFRRSGHLLSEILYSKGMLFI